MSERATIFQIADHAINIRQSSRRFGDKNFYTVMDVHTHTAANEVAKKLRANGYLVRVVFNPRSVDTYRVYVRRK